MKEIYLVCTRSAITASALTYVINSSPDFYNMSHNNLWLEEHSEWFGKAHIINDWWNLHDKFKAYNYDVRNNVVLSEQNLIAIAEAWRTFPTTKNICLFTHARNTADIMMYAKRHNLPVKVITTIMGNNSHHFVSAFLRREYNDEMNDFESNHIVWEYMYNQLITQDSIWQQYYDYCFQMSDWLHKPQSVYTKLGVEACSDIGQWTEQYLRWNDSGDLVAPVTAKRNDNVVKRMEFLAWAYNTGSVNLHRNEQQLAFAELLFKMYEENQINSPTDFIQSAQKTLISA